MPTYCETPAILSSFPAEPVNTWSNLVIIILGLIAIYLVLREGERGKRAGLFLLSLLLLATGVGSLLWHGLRTETYLTLDWVPGVLFVLVFTYAWLRRFYGRGMSIATLALFILLEGISIAFGGQYVGRSFFFVPTAPVIVLFATWLISRTYQESSRLGFLAILPLFFALIALLFRSIDSLVCQSFPIGTHFLWHGFLSLAGFCGILLLMVIDYTRARRANAKIRMDIPA